MAFVTSVSYLAAGQVVVTLNTGSYTKCYYPHMRISPGTGVTSSTVVFDNRPGVNYIGGILSSVWPIPMGARTATVTPAGGNAVVELGKDR